MGILSRISTVIKSNINDVISKSEDPKKMLEQIIIELQQKLGQAKQEVAGAIADEKRLEKQMKETRSTSTNWEKKAEIAVAQGRDDLAMQALQRFEEQNGLATQYEEQWAAQKQSCDQLKSALQQMQSRIQEASRKKSLLIARQKRSEAQQTINRTMASVNDPGAFDSFSRMEEKINRMEAKADAEQEINSELSGNKLEDEFKQLEASHGVQDKLAAMKARMGKA